MSLIETFIKKAQQNPRKIVYPEGSDERIIIAASKAAQMGIAKPIIIGEQENIHKMAAVANMPLEEIQIIDIKDEPERLEKD